MQPLRAEPNEPMPEVKATALALPDAARALVITNDAELQVASDFLATRCKAVLKEADAVFDPIVKAAHSAHKVAVEQKRTVIGPIEEAERIVKAAITAYVRERDERQRKLEAAAQVAARKLQEEEALSRAQRLQDSGRPAEAMKVLERPLPALSIVPPPPPKVAGLSLPTTWSGQVTDFEALVVAAGTDPQARALLQVNQVALNQLAKALKSSLSIPGVQAVPTTGVASRG